jgi:hypothetical protein
MAAAAAAPHTRRSSTPLNVAEELQELRRLIGQVLAQTKVIAENQGAMQKLLRDLTQGGPSIAGTSSGSTGSSRLQDHYAARSAQTATLLEGLFTGLQYCGKTDGVKRMHLFVRQLTIDPYGTDEDLRKLFMENRLDLPAINVAAWFDSHKQALMKMFVDRRNVFVRAVKAEVAVALGVGSLETKSNAGELKQWKFAVSQSWHLAKRKAKRKHKLQYPKFVSDIVHKLAVKGDPVQEYSRERIGNDEAVTCDWGKNLIILEGLALNIIAVSFGKHILKKTGAEMACSEETLGGKYLIQACQVVLKQRLQLDQDPETAGLHPACDEVGEKVEESNNGGSDGGGSSGGDDE